MTFTKKEGRYFTAMCAVDCTKTACLFLLTAKLCSAPATFWSNQVPIVYSIRTSLIDLLLLAALRVALLCGIFLSSNPDQGGRRQPVALSVAYCTFRLLTLLGSIFLAIKLAFFDYSSLGSGSASASAVTMIVGSLIALWVESVVPYVLTAAREQREQDADTKQLLVAEPMVAIFPPKHT